MERNETPKVSVIAPVYGVEQFVGRAVDSMMRQTLRDVEFIFVDDCSPDRSMDVIMSVVGKYPKRAGSVKVIRHEENKGLPAARNTGLDAARGKYIFHWDSDDFANPEMLEELYLEAERKGADYVWCDWILSFEKGERVMSQPDADTPRRAITLMLAGEMKYNVWNKLVARHLYISSGIRFPEGSAMGEDMTMIKLMTFAKTTGHVAKPLYHYIRTNCGAMTQIYSDRHLADLDRNTLDTCNYLTGKIYDEDIHDELNWFKLNVKLPFLFTGRRPDIGKWRQWYPESDRYIKSNPYLASRTKIVQSAASCGLDSLVLLYNHLVNLYYLVAVKH